MPVTLDGTGFIAADDLSNITGVKVTHGEAPDWASWFEPPAMLSPSDAAIEETENDALYQTEFFGPDLGFDISIENGRYEVVLYFAETAMESERDRVFDVSVQGECA